MVKENPAAEDQRHSKIEKGDPIVFRTIEEILVNEPDRSGVLVGDCQIMRGAVCVIAGPAGCGKSTIAFDLAVAGVTRSDWMGLPVHRSFKTLIVQTENGAIRLYRDALSLNESGKNLEFGDKIRISNPPEFGADFGDKDFCDAIRSELDRKKFLKGRFDQDCELNGGPDVVILDPWNSFCPGDTREATIATIKAMRTLFGSGDDAPAIVIVAHSRKGSGSSGQKEVEPHDLLNEISGSLTLPAHARSAFFVKPDRKDGVEGRIQWTCVKNNNGKFGKPSYFQRRDGSAAEGRFALDSDQTPAVVRKAKVKKGRGAKSSRDRIAFVLSEVSAAGHSGLVRSDLIETLSAKFEIAEKSATNLISELVKKKEYLVQDGQCLREGPAFAIGLESHGFNPANDADGKESGPN